MKLKLICFFVFLSINLSLTFKTSGKIKENKLDSIYYSELVYQKPSCLMAINDSNGKVAIISKPDYIVLLFDELKGQGMSNIDSVVFVNLMNKKYLTQGKLFEFRKIHIVDKYNDSVYFGISDRQIMRKCFYGIYNLKEEYLNDERKLYYIIYKLIKMRKFVSYWPSVKRFYLYP